MSTSLRRTYYTPTQILIVFTSVVVMLLFFSFAAASTQQKALTWVSGITAVGALAAVVGGLGLRLNRVVAFRSATIEAQKMLLEINKQYVAHPELLYLEGEHVGPVPTDDTFKARLKAMTYLKLNVFELIFAVLPGGRERETWVRYFEWSLCKSTVLTDELVKNRDVYHEALMYAYDEWKTKPTKSKASAT